MDTEGVHARSNARPTSIGWVTRVDVGARARRGGGFVRVGRGFPLDRSRSRPSARAFQLRNKDENMTLLIGKETETGDGTVCDVTRCCGIVPRRQKSDCVTIQLLN